MDITPDDLTENNEANSTIDEIREHLDGVRKTLPGGSITTAISDTIGGINITQTPGAVPYSRDQQGFAFFTRPTMNMTAGNLRLKRNLARLLDDRPDSIRRMIRASLDIDAELEGYPSKLLNPMQSFIPILTNQLINISGFPDKEAIPWVSKPGYYKEVVSFVDNATDYNESFEVTANFRNIPGDPITEMMSAWVDYASLVFQGTLIPKAKYLVRNQIDYQTRIYRLVLDPTRKYVQNIFATNAAYPLNAPVGARATIEETGPLTQVNNQISIRFQCIGFMSYDDILVDEFNAVVCRGNSDMKDQYRELELTKLEDFEKSLFNHKAYPRINPKTMELEWWVYTELYAKMLGLTPESINTDEIF